MKVKKPKKRKGFTLVELLVVLVIVSILSYALWRVYSNHVNNARATEIANEVSKLQTALTLFNSQTGYYPDSIQELWKNDDGSGNPIPGWSGPYIQPTDPNATSLKSGSGATITVSCDSTNGEAVVFTNVPQKVAEIYDEKFDNNDLTSGAATYDDKNHVLKIMVKEGAVSCI